MTHRVGRTIGKGASCMAAALTRERIERARHQFFRDGTEDLDAFPQMVYDSWKRSLDYGLDPAHQCAKRLKPSELDDRRRENAVLLEIATETLTFLHKLVKGSGFVLFFADKDGYILKIIGDQDALEDIQSKENPLVEGACRHESAFGTGGIGTAIALRKPVQLASYEMFYPSKHEFTGIGAPLIDEDGKLWGAVCMSGAWNQVHPHTLGLVTATSYAIMRQFSLKKLYNRLSAAENQLQTIIATINQGVFLADNRFCIMKTNDTAAQILNCTKEEICGKRLSDMFPSLDFAKLKKNVYDRDLQMQGKYGTVSAFVTIQFVQSAVTKNGSALLVTFRKSPDVRKFVTKYIGATARFNFDDIIGHSTVLTMAKTYAQIASSNSANILLLGESGTGKELFAQSIHNSSAFATGPFVAVNCGAIPKSLVESELFGYESGAFTGAKREGSAGKFELANNGTIFLDEVGDMPYEVQVHLLRILQTREVTRIGGKKSIPLNIRIIAGTNVDLQQAIENKTFRSDLFYRLNVLSIQIPPLRERQEDIPDLTAYFIKKYQPANKTKILGVTDEVMQIFMQYPWPGNIRELENAVERACLLTQDEYIRPEHITSTVLKYRPAAIEGAPEEDEPEETTDGTIHDAERELIIKQLTAARGNVKQAAVLLGISRRTLYRKMQRLDIEYQKIRGEGSEDAE